MIIALHLLDLVRQPCPQRESQRGKEGEGEAKKDFREQVRDEQRVLRERERQGTCYGMGVGRSSEEEGAARRGSTGHVIFLACSVRGAVNGLCAHARAREDSTRAIMKCCGESQSCARGILRIAVGQRGEGAQDKSFSLRTACVVQSTGCALMHAREKILRAPS